MTTLGTKGEQLDILIRQGATFGLYTMTLTNPDTSPVNLTGCTIRAQVRKTYDAVDIAATFTCTVTTPASGIFTFEIPAAQTTLLTCGASETDEASQYVWDMEMVDSSGRVIPLLYGNAAVFREVTK